MPITLIPLQQDVDTPCPACGAPMLRQGSSSRAAWLVDILEEDGDTIPFRRHVPPERNTIAYYGGLDAFMPACCRTGMVSLTITSAALEAEADEAFTDTYFWLNGERGPSRWFVALRGPENWFVQGFESRHGRVLTHHVGPLAWPHRAWIGPSGVASCGPGDGSPWPMAIDLVHELWDDLRALHHALPGAARRSTRLMKIYAARLKAAG